MHYHAIFQLNSDHRAPIKPGGAAAVAGVAGAGDAVGEAAAMWLKLGQVASPPSPNGLLRKGEGLYRPREKEEERER